MIKWIIIALLGLILLGYLGFDVRKAIDASATKSNIQYAKEVVVHIWDNYLAKPAKYLWGVFIDLIWNTAIDSLKGTRTNPTATSTQALPK